MALLSYLSSADFNRYLLLVTCAWLPRARTEEKSVVCVKTPLNFSSWPVRIGCLHVRRVRVLAIGVSLGLRVIRHR